MAEPSIEGAVLSCVHTTGEPNRADLALQVRLDGALDVTANAEYSFVVPADYARALARSLLRDELGAQRRLFARCLRELEALGCPLTDLLEDVDRATEGG